MTNASGSSYVEVQPGIKVWVEDVGEGLPIVFLHGWPASSRMFEYQLSELPKHGLRCICPDTRGFGRSDKPWGGYDYDQLSDDLKAILESFQLTDVTLAGFSMGGAIAVRYFSRHGGARVNRLVLLGAAVPCVTRRDDFPYGLDRSACDDLIRATYRDRPEMLAEFSEMFFNDPNALSPGFKAWFTRICEEAAGYATIKCCECFRDADLRPDLAAIQVPTLILHGESDRICDFALAEQTHAALPGSRLIRIPDAGHGFCYEQRNRINEELLDFIGLAEQIGEGALAPELSTPPSP